MKSAKPIPAGRIDDLRQMLARIHPRYSLLLDLGVCTGLRITDLLNLRVQTVSKRTFSVKEKKTGKTRRISVSADMRKALKAYVAEYNLGPFDYLFFKSAYSPQISISRSQAYRTMTDASRSLNLGKISPHSMRKTFASELYKRTGSFEAVQKELNHSSISTTLLYLFGSEEGAR